jgi:hypothetical protein
MFEIEFWLGRREQKVASVAGSKVFMSLRVLFNGGWLSDRRRGIIQLKATLYPTNSVNRTGFGFVKP